MFKEIIDQVDYSLKKKSFSVENTIVKYDLSEVETDNNVGLLFTVTILINFPSDTEQLIYYNFYITENGGINITVHGKFGLIICRRYVESIDDFESTVFQFNTIVNMYDLDKTYYTVLLEMRNDFFERKMKQQI